MEIGCQREVKLQKRQHEWKGGLGLKLEDGTSGVDQSKGQRSNLDPIRSNHRYKIPANHSDSEGLRTQANTGLAELTLFGNWRTL